MPEWTVLNDFNPFGGASPAPFTPTPQPTVPGSCGFSFAQELRQCTACSARAEARQVVLGAGPLDAVGMVIGQNPGVEEDRSGLPFLGAGGDELNLWLRALGLAREKLVITNALKCHTNGNRLPKATELRTCVSLWLLRELEALTALRVLFPVGKPAVTAVLGKAAPPMTPLTAMHYRIRVRDGTTARELSVFPLPHPAFLLRARHLGPLMQTVLGQVRLTLEQELPDVYAVLKR